MKKINIDWCDALQWFGLVFWAAAFMGLLVGYGCGGKTDPESAKFLALPADMPDQFIDPAFDPYIAQYKADAIKHGAPEGFWGELYRMEWSDPGALSADGVFGFCEIAKSINGVNKETIETLRFIVLDPTIPSERMMISFIYHELTHCIYEIDHSRRPEDIMAPWQTVEDEYLDATWDTRVKELFERVILLWKTDGRI